MLKKYVFILALFVLVLPFSSVSQQITSFDDLMATLKNGKKVTAVFQYSKFKLISDNEEQEKVPDAIGGMQLSTWEFFAPNAVKNKEAFVVFSESKLIKNPKGEGMVYNYVKVRVSADQKVKVTAQYLQANSLEVKMDENFFGTINDGKNDGGLTLFVSE
ncbi:MAG: hypothetical protein IPH45_02880 [Bacteroidales bacterium]|nr:hypothetical protein [Bacteroidales bacterium]MBK7173206.1 hypothetical protein [Bacteroidales bacterium]